MTTTKPPTILEQMELSWVVEASVRAGYQVGIYDQSRLLAIVEAEPKLAWKRARAAVRALAHQDGVQGEERFARTANRVVVMRGIYRALPMRAQRSADAQRT